MVLNPGGMSVICTDDGTTMLRNRSLSGSVGVPSRGFPKLTLRIGAASRQHCWSIIYYMGFGHMIFLEVVIGRSVLVYFSEALTEWIPLNEGFLLREGILCLCLPGGMVSPYYHSCSSKAMSVNCDF